MQSKWRRFKLASQAALTYAGSPRISHFPSAYLTPNLVANSTFSLTPPFKACRRPKKRNLRTNEQHKQRKKERKRRDLSEKDFVGERAVDVGGVEEGDTGVDGVVDERDHVFFGLGRAIGAGHAHATEALCGHLQSLRT
jgi:hypothetical protein